jgi:hypothetical protein
MVRGLALISFLSLTRGAPAAETPPRSRTFEVTYRATVRQIPDGAKELELWLPLPQTDRNQTIHRSTVDAPVPLTIGRETVFGVQCVHVRVESPKAPITVTMTVEATRTENAGAI